MMRRRDTIVIGWRVRCGCPYRRYVTSGLWGTGAREEATLFATLAEARQAAKSIERVCRSGPRVVRVVRSPPRTTTRRGTSAMTRTDIAAARLQTHWTARQRNHLRRLIRAGATIAYWCSDVRGRPANHGMAHLAARGWTARAGLVQAVMGPLRVCTEAALHATLEPHLWAGTRVWVVGLVGEVQRDGDKFAALHREIVGEVMPEEALSASVGVRIGRKDLDGANLTSANLDGADLRRASLDGASLAGASIDGASLDGANLAGANLSGANLRRACLRRANLDGASLDGANLTSASLDGANLVGANLSGANLRRANLDGANLVGANLVGASLVSADLTSAWILATATPPAGWIARAIEGDTRARLVRA